MLHCYQPFGHCASPEVILSCCVVVGIVVYFPIHLEHEAQVLLYHQHPVAINGIPRQKFHISMERISQSFDIEFCGVQPNITKCVQGRNNIMQGILL